jgi:hypothetical protein
MTPSDSIRAWQAPSDRDGLDATQLARLPAPCAHAGWYRALTLPLTPRPLPWGEGAKGPSLPYSKRSLGYALEQAAGSRRPQNTSGYRAVVAKCALIIRECAPDGAGIIAECAPATGAAIAPAYIAYRAATLTQPLRGGR